MCFIVSIWFNTSLLFFDRGFFCIMMDSTFSISAARIPSSYRNNISGGKERSQSMPLLLFPKNLNSWSITKSDCSSGISVLKVELWCPLHLQLRLAMNLWSSPGMTACLLNVKLVPHLENVPPAPRKNGATVGFQCSARIIIIIWWQSSSCYSSVLELLNFLRTRKATAELPMNVAVQ